MQRSVIRQARHGLAFDIGTDTVRVATRERIVVEEPFVLAVDAQGAPLAIGREALSMAARSHSARVVRPLRGATVHDRGACVLTLSALLDELRERIPRRSTTVLSTSICSSPADLEALRDVLADAWAGDEAAVVDAPLAAAVGASVPVEADTGTMVVDIGRGATEAAVLAGGHIVASCARPIGGADADEEIARFLRLEYGLVVSDSEAEALKVALSTHATEAEVVGADAVTGLARRRVLTADAMAVAVAPVVDAMAAVVDQALRSAPAELAADVAEFGAVLTGGGSRLIGLADAVTRATGVAARPAALGGRAVIEGARDSLKAHRSVR